MKRLLFGSTLLLLCTFALPAHASVWRDSFMQGVESQVAAAANASTSADTSAPDAALSNADLMAITRPAIVRILTHVEGTSTSPGYSMDIVHFTIASSSTAKSKSIPVDQYFTGSGFFISSDGYILTAAHVLSMSSIKTVLAAALMLSAIKDKVSHMTKAEDAALSKVADPEAVGTQFAKDVLAYFQKTLKHDLRISAVVVAPETTSSKQSSALTAKVDAAIDERKNTEDLFARGTPLTIVSANDRFIDDEQDVAIAKVAGTGYPSLRIGDSARTAVGENIFIFGYPGDADNAGITTNATFTDGTVSSLKNSTLGTFKYIQTNAKVSSGSSGGPLMDAQGNVIGIVALASQTSEAGDNFAFAVPITAAQTFLNKAHVTPTQENDYTAHFLAGVALQKAQHCKAALDEFAAAGEANTKFNEIQSYLDPHTEACNALIAAGNSIDSTFDQYWVPLKQKPWTFWVMVGGGVAGVVVLLWVIRTLLKRLRREEQQIEELQSEAGGSVHMQPTPAFSGQWITNSMTSAQSAAGFQFAPVGVGGASTSAVSTPVTTAAASPTIDPQMAAYIASSRVSGASDETIRQALLGVGWSAAEVQTALSQSL